MIAQGNALGRNKKRNKALKAREEAGPTPETLRAFSASTLKTPNTQGVALGYHLTRPWRLLRSILRILAS